MFQRWTRASKFVQLLFWIHILIIEEVPFNSTLFYVGTKTFSNIARKAHRPRAIFLYSSIENVSIIVLTNNKCI